MAGFLRKKRQDSVPPPPPVRTPSPPVTPLFARFATSAAEAQAAQRVVSSPMALASSPRRDQAPGMTNGWDVRGGAQQQQREDTKQTRYTVGPSYVQPNHAGPSNSAAASTSNGNSSYGSPAQKRSRTQTLPTASAPTTSTPSSRRFSHVPGADKPLPTIYPQDNHSDPLGSTPPQSALPANRRASARGFPPQTSVAIQNLPNGRVMSVAAQQPHISLANGSPAKPLQRNPIPPLDPLKTPPAIRRSMGDRIYSTGSLTRVVLLVGRRRFLYLRRRQGKALRDDGRPMAEVPPLLRTAMCGYRNCFMILVPPHMHDAAHAQ
ncbi:hypothetical protein B0H17DRAFT_1193136 [Mycena rosella]|uniref:Uncharacterized protein n=1 Tax=Mycena rosella TaxID=1033263 RepID=A0AAD7GU99_MYCRO|nr:hypothetical protein B0H17DRAFT_1193136 [Mycena rosella]